MIRCHEYRVLAYKYFDANPKFCTYFHGFCKMLKLFKSDNKYGQLALKTKHV